MMGIKRIEKTRIEEGKWVKHYRSDTEIVRTCREKERDEDVKMRRWTLKCYFMSLVGDPWWPCDPCFLLVKWTERNLYGQKPFIVS